MGLSLQERRALARGISPRTLKLWGNRKFLGMGNRSTATTALVGANNDFILYSKKPGVGGNAVTFAITLPGSPVNAVQTVATGAATAGTFTLTLPASLGGGITAAITFNATAAAVQSAILATAGAPAGSVTVTGGPLPGASVVVTFTAPGPQALIVVNGAGLTGGAPSVTSTTAGVAATANSPLAVSVAGNAISAAAATNASSVITSRAIDVARAVQGTPAAHALIHLGVAPGNDGTGTVVAQAPVSLAGATATPAP